MLFFHVPPSRKARERKYAELCEKARKHFAPVLNKTINNEPAFDLTGKVEGGGAGEYLFPLDGFVSLFWDLIDKGDYRKSSFIARTFEGHFMFTRSLFDEWQAAGCLLWD